MVYSKRIDDPAFLKYINNTRKWSIIFSMVIASIAIIGFYIYGEISLEMENPDALYIGLGIGSMFILIAIFQIVSRNSGSTWDGYIIDKKQILKKRKINHDNNNSWQEYMEFTVFIKSNQGKMYCITVDDDDTLYNYYKVGDKIRHHKGLNSYEKYDKSNDTIIFCNACASQNDIGDESCHRCNCPLLK